MGEPHQIGIEPGVSMTTKSWLCSTVLTRFGEGREFLGLDFIEPHAEAAGDAIMHRNFELDARRAPPNRGDFRCNG